MRIRDDGLGYIHVILGYLDPWGPIVLLSMATWSPLDGIGGVLKGSGGVMVVPVLCIYYFRA